MVTTRLECYPHDGAYATFNLNQTTVGGADLWHDASDATYVRLIATSGVAARVFEIDDLTGVAPADVTAIRFGLLVESVPSIFPAVTVAVSMHSSAEGSPGVSSSRGRVLPSTLNRQIYITSMTLFDGAGNTQTAPGSDLATMLVSGAAYGRVAINQFDEQTTIYEMWVEVDHAGGQPYRRIFPRDDGLAGGAPRNYPVSKGVQTSNRTSGYL